MGIGIGTELGVGMGMGSGLLTPIMLTALYR